MFPRACAGAAAAWLVVLPAHALEYGFGVGYGARYTDNALRTAQNPQTDVEHNLIGSGRVLLQTPRVDLNAIGSIDLRYYSNDSFDPRSLETFNGIARYTFAPNRLTWTISDTLQNTQVNALVPTTLDNLEQTNRFSTGPNITLRTSSRNTIAMLARYENDWYEESAELSNERGIVDLNWRYQMTEPTAMVLRYRYESVQYRDDVPGTDFVKDSLTAGFEGRLGATVSYRLEAGPGRVRQDLREEVTTRVGIARLSRQISRDSGFSVTLSSDFSDSGRLAQADPIVDPVLQVTGVNAGQPDFVHTRAGSADFFSTLGWLTYRLAATVRDEDFQVSDRDVMKSGGGVVLEYVFSPRLVGFASGNFTRSDYPILMRIDDDSVAFAGLRFPFRPRWAVGVSVRYDQRDSTDDTQSYTENSVLASISYNYESLRLGIR